MQPRCQTAARLVVPSAATGRRKRLLPEHTGCGQYTACLPTTAADWQPGLADGTQLVPPWWSKSRAWQLLTGRCAVLYGRTRDVARLINAPHLYTPAERYVTVRHGCREGQPQAFRLALRPCRHAIMLHHMSCRAS